MPKMFCRRANIFVISLITKMFAIRASLYAARAGKASAKPAPPELPPSTILENLLIQHGPQTVPDCWKLAEPAGIKSKIRMKALLMWLVGRKRVRQINHFIKETKTKEFLYGPPKKPLKNVPVSAEGLDIEESSA